MSGPGSTHPETHTPVRLSNSHSTVPLSRPLSAPETRVAFFSAHIHAQTHTHTARESTDPLYSAECFPQRWSKWSSLTLLSQPVLPLRALQTATSSHTHTVNMSDSRATSSLIPRQSLTNDDGTKNLFFWSILKCFSQRPYGGPPHS